MSGGKRPSLAASMRAVAEASPAAATLPSQQLPHRSPDTAPGHAAAEPAGPRPKGFYAATRAGKKKATATLSNAAHRQLKLLAVDHGGVEALLNEAINDLFRKHGKPPIA